MVVGFVVAVVVATTGAGSTGTSPNHPNGSASAGGDINGEMVALDELRVGQCARYVADGRKTSEMLVVSCNDPHEAEIAAIVDLPGATFPGDEALDQQVGDTCQSRIEAYALGSSDDPDLEVFFLRPDEQDWMPDDVNRATCLAVHEKPITGSIKS